MGEILRRWSERSGFLIKHQGNRVSVRCGGSEQELLEQQGRKPTHPSVTWPRAWGFGNGSCPQDLSLEGFFL